MSLRPIKVMQDAGVTEAEAAAVRRGIRGLLRGRRNVERSLGLHCTNRCIMRQGLRVPDDWEAITADRVGGFGFCPACLRDLRRYVQLASGHR